MSVLTAVLLLAAAEPRWGLTFKAPPQCVQPGELAELVERRVGRSLFGPDADLRIEGSLRAADAPPAKWSARLTLLDANGTVLGTRDVTSDGAGCRSIDGSLTLVISLMIDARLQKPLPPPPPEAPVVTPPPLAPVPAPAVDDFGRLLRRERSGIWLGGFKVEQEAFYGMVGRADLQGSLAARRVAKGVAFTGGSVTLATGILLITLEALAHVGSDTHWPLVSGAVLASAGVVGLIVGAIIRVHPTSDDEDDLLIEKWNLGQRVSTQ